MSPGGDAKNGYATLAVAFSFFRIPAGIESEGFDKPTSGEYRLGRRAASWHGSPSRILGCLRRFRRSRMQRELRTNPAGLDGATLAVTSFPPTGLIQTLFDQNAVSISLSIDGIS